MATRRVHVWLCDAVGAGVDEIMRDDNIQAGLMVVTICMFCAFVIVPCVALILFAMVR